jgi:excisionase family DNA binding protein
MQNKFMTVIEASRALKVTVDTVYRLLYSGRLEARKDEGRWMILARSIEERRRTKEVRDANIEIGRH